MPKQKPRAARKRKRMLYRAAARAYYDDEYHKKEKEEQEEEEEQNNPVTIPYDVPVGAADTISHRSIRRELRHQRSHNKWRDSRLERYDYLVDRMDNVVGTADLIPEILPTENRRLELMRFTIDHGPPTRIARIVPGFTPSEELHDLTGNQRQTLIERQNLSMQVMATDTRREKGLALLDALEGAYDRYTNITGELQPENDEMSDLFMQ